MIYTQLFLSEGALNLDAVDRCHPNVDDHQLIQEAAKMNLLRELIIIYVDQQQSAFFHLFSFYFYI